MLCISYYVEDLQKRNQLHHTNERHSSRNKDTHLVFALNDSDTAVKLDDASIASRRMSLRSHINLEVRRQIIPHEYASVEGVSRTYAGVRLHGPIKEQYPSARLTPIRGFLERNQ